MVHSVLRRLAPEAAVVDLVHQVAPHDVRAGALALRRAAPWLAPGVAVAVVDPGVGTTRRAVVLLPRGTSEGPGRLLLVGPDNGLLLPAADALGGVDGAVALPPAEYPAVPALGGPGGGEGVAGPTFDGRDVFAPAAAALAMGADPGGLGTWVDPSTLVPGPSLGSRAVEGGLLVEVLWVDRFGNVELGLDPAELEGTGERVEVDLGGNPMTARRVRAFADLAPGELGLLTDASGLAALVLDRRSAASHLGLAPRDDVLVRPHYRRA